MGYNLSSYLGVHWTTKAAASRVSKNTQFSAQMSSGHIRVHLAVLRRASQVLSLYQALYPLLDDHRRRQEPALQLLRHFRHQYVVRHPPPRLHDPHYRRLDFVLPVFVYLLLKIKRCSVSLFKSCLKNT